MMVNKKYIIVKDCLSKRDGDYVVAIACMNCGGKICLSIEMGYPVISINKTEIVCNACGCKLASKVE